MPTIDLQTYLARKRTIPQKRSASGAEMADLTKVTTDDNAMDTDAPTHHNHHDSLFVSDGEVSEGEVIPEPPVPSRSKTQQLTEKPTEAELEVDPEEVRRFWMENRPISAQDRIKRALPVEFRPFFDKHVAEDKRLVAAYTQLKGYRDTEGKVWEKGHQDLVRDNLLAHALSEKRAVEESEVANRADHMDVDPAVIEKMIKDDNADLIGKLKTEYEPGDPDPCIKPGDERPPFLGEPVPAPAAIKIANELLEAFDEYEQHANRERTILKERITGQPRSTPVTPKTPKSPALELRRPSMIDQSRDPRLRR